MTTAPNIEMIASSLRHCSLNGGGGGGGGRRQGGGGRRCGGEGGDDSEGVTVELNSDVALPYHWEQCLDIQTGQVYYINWEDGTRTTVDPRTSAFSPTRRSTSSASRRSARTRRDSTPSSGYTSVSSVGAVAADSGYDNEEGDGEDDDEEAESSSSTTSSSSSSTGSSRGSAVSSTLSSFSPTDESASGDNGSAIGAGHVLVAAGCRACFMYFMVPKRADVCPKCGSSGLLHLSRNDYA
ncbi:protein CURLY FLAG LEAF 1-like [Phragmites australis]|uniref:protein CURLY FLAG LEAF 1-like n=1 Tax=Phragmites australis TaxID=29695 RepID=UPI002D7969B2|nr:protein CURLY FLAG LEAF 1-like [Phragmites australis]